MLAFAAGVQEMAIVGFLILLLVMIPAWVFGGGALLFVGGRFLARAPKATYWRSVGANAVAGVVAACVFGAFAAGAAGLARAWARPFTMILGMFFGAAAALLVTWLIIKAMFATSFARAKPCPRSRTRLTRTRPGGG